MAAYGGAPSAEQIPILCGRCGGHVQADASLRVQCRYCGNVEQLPPDSLTRALELKRRIASAANGAAQLDGTQMALANIFEDRGAYFRVTGIYLAFFAFILVYSAIGSWEPISKAPDNLAPILIMNALTGPLFIGGGCVALAIALAVGRWQYRKTVRPLVSARPPKAPGAPMRCRGCGADLPSQRSPLVKCHYCSTTSVVTKEVQAHASELLAKEEQDLRARAMGAVSNTARLSVHMKRTAIVCFVGVYVVIMVLIKVVQTAVLP